MYALQVPGEIGASDWKLTMVGQRLDDVEESDPEASATQRAEGWLLAIGPANSESGGS